MKRTAILLIITLALTVTGCDFFRRVAGRPVSADIENKRVAILKAEEAALQAYLDSVKMVREKVVSDSLAALDSLKAYGTMMNGPAVLGGLTGEPLSRRYHVIIGAFKARENAEKLASKAVSGGYDVQLIEFRRGLVAVGTCPSDKIAETVAEFGRLRNEKFCPGEAWILVNE